MAAMLSTTSILMSLAFGGIFFLLLLGGSPVIGGTGFAMCIIGAFFDSFPITPMSGKDVIDHKKSLWAALFIVTLTLYALWLLFI
jgi:hypothetical protein